LYLPIETIPREFDAKCLVAHRALQRGYTVFIGRRFKGFREVARFGPAGVYFDKSFPKDLQQYEALLAAGVVPVTLDEEGLVLTNEQDYEPQVRPEAFTISPFAFAWGARQKERMLRFGRGRIAPDQIRVTGNPRFDLLRPEYCGLFREDAEQIRERYGRLVLINSNFTLCNPHPDYGDMMVFLRRMRRITSEAEEVYYRNMLDYKLCLFNRYVDMIRDLAAAYPRTTMVIRPHPSEDIRTWKSRLAGLPNAVCIFEGSANAWIHACACLIHSGCTTGIEAWILRKPVIRYNQEPHSRYEPELPNRFGYYAPSVNQVLEYVGASLEGGLRDTFECQMPLALEDIAGLEGKLAADRILDELDGMSLPPRQPDRSPTMLDRAGRFARGLLQPTRRKEAKAIEQQKFPGINKEMIKNRLAFFDTVSPQNRATRIGVRKIDSDIYALRRRSSD
jgi:surface carbohydrate biosynthesis protein